MIEQFHIQGLIYNEEQFQAERFEKTITAWKKFFDGDSFALNEYKQSFYQFLLRH